MTKKVEYLIVGQGLAGSFLAYQLFLKKIPFMVVDHSIPNSASKVAAGLINPFALRRLIPSWRAKEFLHYNSKFYSSLSAQLGEKNYYQKINFHKLIESEDELNFWQSKINRNEVEEWVESTLSVVDKKVNARNVFKVGKLKNCYWLDIGKLLSDFRSFLQKNSMLIEEKFDYSSFDQKLFRGVQYNKLLFAEGSAIQDNPLFNYLPYRLNKGELLTFKSDQYVSKGVLKKKMFVLPIGMDQYKIGATYAWDWKNIDPELEQKEKLIGAFKEMSVAEMKILDHQAGLRPAVKDRRPLMGAHPTKPNVFVFNGMGSRGCLIAPKLAEELINCIELGIPLDPKCDIARFDP